MPEPVLVDSFGRRHTNLRLSITDRCNIRCFYCMPREDVVFQPRHQLLTYEELQRFVRVVAGLGIDRIRITGGEPLVRLDVDQLVRQLRQTPGIRDLALTTNGILLERQAAALRAAGLDRLNISLDTLQPDTFERISGRRELHRVLAGIEAARQAGFRKIRLNAIAIRGLTEDEVIPLARFARERDLELRFIEFMPLDADQNWQTDQVLRGEEIRGILERVLGPLAPRPSEDPSQPARDYEYRDGRGRVGFINPVSEPFCGACNRLRLTAEGKVRNCLFSTEEHDARGLMRGGGSDDDIADLVRQCVAGKKAAHGMDSPEFTRPERAMYQIGG